MNRILVLYDSRSGNVAKMAQLVAEGAQSLAKTEVRLKSVDEAAADDVIWCDGYCRWQPDQYGRPLVENETVLGRDHARTLDGN